MAIDQGNRLFLGARLDNQQVSSTAWQALILSGAANPQRDCVQIHVLPTSVGSLQVNDNNTDVVGWWAIGPGQTFDVPFGAEKSVYVRSSGGNCTFKAQEVQL